MNNEQIGIVVTFVILLLLFLNGCYFFFQTWFKYLAFQRRIVSRNEENSNRLFFFKHMMAWVHHWSFKWFARLISILFLTVGGIGLIALLKEVL